VKTGKVRKLLNYLLCPPHLLQTVNLPGEGGEGSIQPGVRGKGGGVNPARGQRKGGEG
jgi:hypothetical protein